jgi:hypothetical protein
MEIVAITVCVNYHDILTHMMGQNARFFSRWYFVTSPEDSNTLSLIKESMLPNVVILLYNDFYKNAKFNFGGARRFAQEYIDTQHNNANILFLDADIYLPDNFLSRLPDVLAEDTIYGVARRNDFWSTEDFKSDKNSHRHNSGATIIGFFQLYKQHSSYMYKDSHNCAKCDTDFRNMFRGKKLLDISVKHLGRGGTFWDGRLADAPKF